MDNVLRLAKCPFCANSGAFHLARYKTSNDRLVHCSNIKCSMFYVAIPMDEWNIRILEIAIITRAETAERELKIANERISWWENFVLESDQLEELKKQADLNPKSLAAKQAYINGLEFELKKAIERIDHFEADAEARLDNSI